MGRVLTFPSPFIRTAIRALSILKENHVRCLQEIQDKRAAQCGRCGLTTADASAAFGQTWSQNPSNLNEWTCPVCGSVVRISPTDSSPTVA